MSTDQAWQEQVASRVRFRWVPGRLSGWGNSLTVRLGLATIGFVFLAEFLIFVPSLIMERGAIISEQVTRAQLAVLAQTEAGVVSTGLENELLGHAGLLSVRLVRNGVEYSLSDAVEPAIAHRFEVFDHAHGLSDFMGLLKTLTAGPGDTLEIAAMPGIRGADTLTFIVDEGVLRDRLMRYGANIFGLSLIISLITAGCLCLALYYSFVRPMRRITGHMTAFRDSPEDARRIITPCDGEGEIAQAEQELHRLQNEVHQALTQRKRMAALGLAVSKINHDLRNILATAQLVSDRLSGSSDPNVQRLAPKLIASLNRAASLCENSLRYGRACEPPPCKTKIALKDLAEDMAASLELPGSDSVSWLNDVPEDLHISADADQIYRILLNLARNSLAAMADQERPRRLRLSAHVEADQAVICIADTGPGIPLAARAALFEPFCGSVHAGGSGLGLAISRELAEAHGGTLELDSTGPEGTEFRLILPSESAAQ